MKKLLLLLFLVALGGQVFGQDMIVFTNVYYTIGNDTWTSSANYGQAAYTGELEDLVGSLFPSGNTGHTSTNGLYPGSTGKEEGATYPDRVSNPDVFLIRAGHMVNFSSIIWYSGTIIIEGGATLEFSKSSGDKGRLIMDGDSRIIVRPGGNIQATSVSDEGKAADFLQIGDERINGLQINALPLPVPFEVEINESFLFCHADLWKKFTTAEDLYNAIQDCIFSTPQPVELTAYSARAAGAVVELSWEAVKEWDFSHYVIEWSTDAQAFSVAATIEGKGTEQGSQRYSFRHTPGTSGVLYYRLLTVDIDGTVEDKGTKMVRLGAEIFNVRAANGRVLVNYNGPADSKVVMFDTSGRIIRMQELSTEGIEISGITPGMYLLQISNSLERKVTRVVIQ
jgi:hypothetical protein